MLLVENEIPGIIPCRLRQPKAIFPGRDHAIRKVQIGARLEGCGSVSPQTPNALWRQFAQQIIRGASLERGASVLDRNRLPLQGYRLRAAGIALRRGHDRETGHRQHTQRCHGKSLHFILHAVLVHSMQISSY